MKQTVMIMEMIIAYILNTLSGVDMLHDSALYKFAIDIDIITIRNSDKAIIYLPSWGSPATL